MDSPLPSEITPIALPFAHQNDSLQSSEPVAAIDLQEEEEDDESVDEEEDDSDVSMPAEDARVNYQSQIPPQTYWERALTGFPQKEDLRTKNHVVFMRTNVFLDLLHHFPESKNSLEAMMLASLTDSKYTALYQRPQLKEADRTRYEQMLDLLKHKHWLFRFQQLRPFIYPQINEFDNWEQLVIYYYFLLKDVVRVRYVLKKMGQGWSTIIFFLKGKDTQVEVEPPQPDSTMFQKQSFSLDLIERLKLKPPGEPCDDPDSPLITINYIEQITRHSTFRLYKEDILKKLRGMNVVVSDEDQPSQPILEPVRNEVVQIFKRAGGRKPGRPRKVPRLEKEIMEKLNISDESYFGKSNENFNKREGERLLKDSRVISPPIFDVNMHRKDRNQHQELSHLEGKQQSQKTTTPQEELKDEKNVLYSSTVMIQDASENGKRMLRTVQDSVMRQFDELVQIYGGKIGFKVTTKVMRLS